VELRQVGASNIYEAYDGSYGQLTDNGASGVDGAERTRLTPPLTPTIGATAYSMMRPEI
jgi:hypothetical protein